MQAVFILAMNMYSIIACMVPRDCSEDKQLRKSEAKAV